MTEERKSRAIADPAIPTTSTLSLKSNCGTDLEADLTLVGGANPDLWAALFDGRIRLATRYSRCGRWLTAGPSKRNGIGAHCAARAVR